MVNRLTTSYYSSPFNIWPPRGLGLFKHVKHETSQNPPLFALIGTHVLSWNVYNQFWAHHWTLSAVNHWLGLYASSSVTKFQWESRCFSKLNKILKLEIKHCNIADFQPTFYFITVLLCDVLLSGLQHLFLKPKRHFPAHIYIYIIWRGYSSVFLCSSNVPLDSRQ